MKAYGALFRIRFIHGLQYRAAALAGLTTQLAWGFMEILAYSAFYRANPAAFPMAFSSLVSYIWIQQAFFSLLTPWSGASDAVSAIVDGNIAYDLARPMNLYNRWFFENVANRLARVALRCAPVLLIAFLLPSPFRMALPSSFFQFALFLLSLALSSCVVAAFYVLDSTSTFYTMSRYNALFVITAGFFSGQYIPLPFFPEPVRKIVELTPFAAMQNMPLRLYSGDIAGADAVRGVALQVFWLIALLCAGKLLMRKSLKRVVAQGG